MPQLIYRPEGEPAESAWIEAIWQQPVQRVFWIYGVPDEHERGGHRHKSCQMALHCVTGSVEVYVQTPEGDQNFALTMPDHYLFLDAHDWRLMHTFSPDAVLMVFASKPFHSTVYYEQPYRPIRLKPSASAASPVLVTHPDIIA